MSRRALTWVLVLPLVGTSVLAGHWLAYRMTGAAAGDAHAYLGHAPQVLALLVLVALVGLAFDTRSGRISARSFVLLGPLVFAAQEHLERVAHGDGARLLLADRTFLIGLALQVPVGLLAAALTARLVRALRAARPLRVRAPLPALLPSHVVPVVALAPPRTVRRVALGRGPPRGRAA